MSITYNKSIYGLLGIVTLFVVVGFFTLWLTPHFSTSERIQLTQDEASQYAISLLQAQNVGEVYTQTQRPLLTTDWVASFFITDTLGDKQKTYYAEYDLPTFTYICEVTSREGALYTVSVDASTGDVVAWNVHTIPGNLENQSPTATLSDSVTSYLEKRGLSAPSLTVASEESATTTDVVGRKVTVLRSVFVLQGSELESPYGKGYVTYVVRSVGDTIVSLAQTFVVPEAYQQEAQASQQSGFGIRLFLNILYFCLLGAAVYVLYIYRSHVRLVYQTPLLLTLGITVLIALETVNGGAAIVHLIGGVGSPDRVVPILLLGLLTTVMFALPFFVFLTAGIVLWKQDSTCHSVPILAKRDVLRMAKSVYLGYMIGGIVIIIFTLTTLTESGGMIGKSVKDLEYLIATHFPVFSIFSLVAFIPAFVEEVTYRLFAFVFITHYFGSRYLGALVATLLWVVPHIESLDFLEIVYFCVLGALLMGVLLRQGLLASVIVHYVVNAALGVFLIGTMFALSDSMVWASVLILALPAVLGSMYAIQASRCTTIK